MPAKRCGCPDPLLDRDADDFVLCLRCGREVSATESTRNEGKIHNGEMNGSRLYGHSPAGDTLKVSSMNDLDRPTEFVGFFAPLWLVEDLKTLSKSHERSVSAELRYLIRQHLENRNASPDKAGVSRAVKGSPLGEQV